MKIVKVYEPHKVEPEILTAKVGRKILTVVAILSIIWGIYYHLAGETLVEGVVELFPLISFCVVIGIGVYRYVNYVTGMRHAAEKAVNYLLIPVVLMTIAHCWMNIQLVPIRDEFHQTVAKGPVSGHMYQVSETGNHHNDGPIWAPDYGGKLTVLVDKRDEVLKSHGYRYLGNWNSEGDVKTIGFCVYTFGL